MVTSQDIQLVFTLDLLNKRAKVEDVTDYASFSESPTALIGLGTILDPAATIADRQTIGNSLIPLFSGATESNWFDVTVNTQTGEALLGNYTVNYQLRRLVNFVSAPMTSGVLSFVGDFTTTFIPGATIYIYGPTSEVGAYTVDQSVFGGGQTLVSLVEDISFTGTVSLIVFDPENIEPINKSITLCHDKSNFNVKLEVTYSCDAACFKSKDVSDYQGVTLTSRTHRIQYPRYANGVEVAPDVVSTNIATNTQITLQNLWTGNYTVSVESEGELQVSNEFVILFGSRSVVERDVICKSSAIKARHCIYKLLQQYDKYCAMDRSTNPIQCALTSINTSYLLMRMYQQAGEGEKANQMALRIIDIANSYGCNCDHIDGTMGPVQVIASGVVDVFYNQFTSPLTEDGDIYYHIDGQDARLPAGDEARVLTIGPSGIPSWRKPQGQALYYSFGSETIAGAVLYGGVTFPSAYITENGEGVEYEIFGRGSSGISTVTARVGGFNGASVEVPNTAEFIIKIRITREGNQWRTEALSMKADSGSISVASVLIPYDPSIDFIQSVVVGLIFSDTFFLRMIRGNYTRFKQLV